jgi:hypothetical protein
MSTTNQKLELLLQKETEHIKSYNAIKSVNKLLLEDNKKLDVSIIIECNKTNQKYIKFKITDLFVNKTYLTTRTQFGNNLLEVVNSECLFIKDNILTIKSLPINNNQELNFIKENILTINKFKNNGTY